MKKEIVINENTYFTQWDIGTIRRLTEKLNVSLVDFLTKMETGNFSFSDYCLFIVSALQRHDAGLTDSEAWEIVDCCDLGEIARLISFISDAMMEISPKKKTVKPTAKMPSKGKKSNTGRKSNARPSASVSR